MQPLRSLAEDNLLTDFLVPRLADLDADRNLQGTVRRRLDPLLAALPPDLALTGKACERLGLDEHEVAYVQLATLRRGYPEALRAAVEGHDNFADALRAARSFAHQSGQEFRPYWLECDGDFVRLEPAARQACIRALATGLSGGRGLTDGKIMSFQSTPGSNYIAPGSSLQITASVASLTSDADKVQVTLRRGLDKWDLTVNLSAPVHQSQHLPFEAAPAFLLRALRQTLARFTPTGAEGVVRHIRERALGKDPEAQFVGEAVAALDRELGTRPTDDGAVERAIEAFLRGELDSLVGAVPKGELDRLAAAT
jgi:hypothetical protein